MKEMFLKCRKNMMVTGDRDHGVPKGRILWDDTISSSMAKWTLRNIILSLVSPLTRSPRCVPAAGHPHRAAELNPKAKQRPSTMH